MKLFRKAIVIIHGFTGNLYDNEYLMNYLEDESMFDVYAETLPGHDKDRFSDASVADWKESIDNIMKRLINNGYTKIYVIGHSMGGILACYAATRYKEVKKVVLVNAAFDYFNFKQNKSDIKDSDMSKYGGLWQKVLRTSPFIVNEFRKLVKEGPEILKDVKCELLVLRSVNDGIIPYDTGDMIINGVNSKEKYITDILDAGHRVLRSDKKEIVSEYIKWFLKGGLIWKTNIRKEI